MTSPFSLFLALSSISKKERSHNRQVMFSHLSHKNKTLRFFIFLTRIKICLPLMAFATATKFVIDLSRYSLSNLDRPFIHVYQYKNEEKVLKALSKDISYEYGMINYSDSYSNWTEPIRWFLSFKYKDLLKLIRISFLLLKRKPVLVALRQIQFIIFFSFFSFYLKKQSFLSQKFFASTESNPEVLAPALAAKKNGAQIFYINHGQLAESLGYFIFDALILSSISTLERVHPHLFIPETPAFFWNPIKCQSMLCPTELNRFLIIGSIVHNPDKCNRLISELKKSFPHSQIHFRPHPNRDMFNKRLLKLLPSYVKVSFAKEVLTEVLPEFDIVFAGNTSSHIETLELGIPSLFYPIDNMPDDYYDFVKKKLILHLNSFDHLAEDIKRFYSSSQWKESMIYFSHPRSESDLVKISNLIHSKN